MGVGDGIEVVCIGVIVVCVDVVVGVGVVWVETVDEVDVVVDVAVLLVGFVKIRPSCPV
jgi:hypothetical protein